VAGLSGRELATRQSLQRGHELFPRSRFDRADVYEAADRANARLGIEVNPVVRTAKQWADPADALVAQIKASAHVTALDTREPVNS
jgi:hypothetical protein